jgi:hypothetical protein
MSERRSDAWVLAGLAFAGLVAGHTLSYRLAAPRGGLPHPYWSSAVTAALLAGVIASLGAIALAHRARLAGRAARPGAWVLLVALQVGGFVVLELGERVVAGVGPAQVLSDPAVLLGVPLQLGVAWLAALVLKLFGRIGEALASPRARPARAPRALGRGTPYSVRPRPGSVRQAEARAPPVAG